MRRILHINLLLLFCIVTFYACKLETSDNGKLDGYWKLCLVDTIATGGRLDLTESSLFWSVQLNMLTVRDNQHILNGEYTFRFDYNGKTLRLYEPRKYEKVYGDTLLTNPSPIRKFGINDLDVTFTIDHLSDRRMHLTDDHHHLYFTKF